MLINNIEIENSKIKYLGHSINNENVTSNYYDNGNSFPVYYNTDIGSDELIFRLYVTADTREDLNSAISSLIYTFKGVNNIQFEDDNYNYKCIYNKCVTELLTPENCILTFTMISQRESADYHRINCSGKICYYFYIGGTKRTEPIISVTLPSSVTEFTYNDVTISNINNSDNELTTNIIIINSEDKTIKLNDVNCFSNCDLVDFPLFDVGKNVLTVSSDLANIQIKYKEKYI